jgi:hypothetical protein
MRCQDPDGCEREAVGTDIVGTPLCREHLDFSALVQRLLNKQLRDAGHPELIPPEAREEETN